MLAILTTHPIQYQVPLWRALASEGRVPFEVWYLTKHGLAGDYDSGFGRPVQWDLDMLSGYPHRFLEVGGGSEVDRFCGVRLRNSFTHLMKEAGTQALWVNGWQVQAYWQGVWRAHAQGIPVWLRAESNDLPSRGRWKALVRRLLLKQLFTRVESFLYIGAANRRMYVEHGVTPQQLHFTPYAVDNGRFAQQAAALRSQRLAIRREWGIPDDARCILFAGKFVRKKRPQDVIEAAQLLVSRGRKVHLLFSGSGELGLVLRQASNVIFEGESTTPKPREPRGPPASFVGFLNQSEIAKAYIAADCLVLPSDYGETWGLVVNEAMACGLPCVVSKACGCAEDLVPGNQQFELGDIGGLARAIDQLLGALPNIRLTTAGVTAYSPEATVRVVTELYAQISGNG